MLPSSDAGAGAEIGMRIKLTGGQTGAQLTDDEVDLHSAAEEDLAADGHEAGGEGGHPVRNNGVTRQGKNQGKNFGLL